jgi:YHS domain-containing protein
MKTLFAVVVAALLAGCAPFVTQSPGHGLSPVNAVSEGGDDHLLLFGYDVVAYFTDGKPVKGDPAIKTVYNDVTFRFANAQHKEMFDKSPDKYIPQFGGYCSNGIAYAIPWGGDADKFRIIDGKLYMFGGQGSLDAFMLDPKHNMELANKYWSEEVKDSNAFIQRTKRLIFRVPHYKSGKELAEEVERAKKKS